MTMWRTNKKTHKKFQMRNKDIAKLIQESNKGAAKAKDFPHTIVFDWNGTVDARNVGVGIPFKVLLTLKEMGKNVIIFTSSSDAKRKLFMRKICKANGISYTDNENILDYADMFVADKDADERKAGQHGVNFVRTGDFNLEKMLPDTVAFQNRKPIIGCTECKGLPKKSHLNKTLAQIGAHEAMEVDTSLPFDKRIVEEVRSYNHEYGGASIGDIVYELNSRGKDLVNQGGTDLYAHMDQDAIQKKVDELVMKGRLKKVEEPDAKPTYFHVHVE